MDGFRVDQNWLGRLTDRRELVVNCVTTLLLPIILALIPLTWTTPFEFQMVPYDLVIVDVVVLDFVQRAYYAQIFLELLILGNDCQSGRMMLLVVRDDVGNQWTFTRQKACTGLKRLRVPHLRQLFLLLPFLLLLKLLVLLRFVERIDLIVGCARIVVQEPELRSDAEVRDGQQNDLLKHGISTELMRVVHVQVHLLAG